MSICKLILKQLERTVHMGAKHTNRQSGSCMIAPDNLYNSVKEHIKPQDNLEHEISTQLLTRFNHDINNMEQKSENVTGIIEEHENEVSSIGISTPKNI